MMIAGRFCMGKRRRIDKMNVKQLIEILKQYDDDLIVSVQGYEGGVTDSFSVDESRVSLNVNDEWCYGEHSEYINADQEVEKRLIIRRD